MTEYLASCAFVFCSNELTGAHSVLVPRLIKFLFLLSLHEQPTRYINLVNDPLLFLSSRHPRVYQSKNMSCHFVLMMFFVRQNNRAEGLAYLFGKLAK